MGLHGCNLVTVSAGDHRARDWGEAHPFVRWYTRVALRVRAEAELRRIEGDLAHRSEYLAGLDPADAELMSAVARVVAGLRAEAAAYAELIETTRQAQRAEYLLARVSKRDLAALVEALLRSLAPDRPTEAWPRWALADPVPSTAAPPGRLVAASPNRPTAPPRAALADVRHP